MWIVEAWKVLAGRQKTDECVSFRRESVLHTVCTILVNVIQQKHIRHIRIEILKYPHTACTIDKNITTQNKYQVI